MNQPVAFYLDQIYIFEQSVEKRHMVKKIFLFQFIHSINKLKMQK